ncbi:hypothetical protein HHK36_007730 [Tetracentron sinense]|uniref:Uncharacterized protein n=1 Tax=Tetracentron sinense TaxID=13715 RepID=A0A834ZD74_TETSI|nr:hypothetical protein HHK36_007730 [Tetracentron sinense]
MSGLKTLLGFFLITWFSVISAEPHQNQDSANTTEPTVYEMLEKFNLPRGILPQGAKGYVLHEDNRFEVFLEGDCKFGVEGGYSLNYKSKIAGKVGFGSLKDLQGVSVKVFFVWLSITEVSIEDGELDLYVGLMSASFPLSNFDECPRCGCGLDCINTVSDS